MADTSDKLDDWLDRIGSIHPVGWDLGLERVSRVADTLDLRHPAPEVVLVAGTNGKGSTCEYLAQMAMAAGLKVGKSTSPHLFRFNERIVVDGTVADDELIIEAFQQIDAARGDVTLTYFEFATLASLLIFRKFEVDIAILEVGLGGRMDAMNIVDPDLCMISSISVDHQSWLGDTREDIAAEKAGIMRPGVPCLVSDRDPPISLKSCAIRTGTPLLFIGRDFDVDTSLETRLPADSFALARHAAEILDLTLNESELLRIAAETRLAGRQTRLKRHCSVLLDVAHNPAAARKLADDLSDLAVKGHIHVILGIYADKDIDGVLQPMLPLVKTWHLVDMEEDRAESAVNLADHLAEVHGDSVKTYAKIALAAEALEGIVDKDDLILVMGSFPVVAGALQYFDDKQLRQ